MGLNTAPARIGVYGGAFDPPHDAHLALARAAIDELALTRLHVVPTGDAWHKPRNLSPEAQRLALCQLAFAGWPEVCVDERELKRQGPSYTVDTLAELHEQNAEAALFLFIGGDQAQKFRRWHRAEDIVRLATVVVAARGGETVDMADPLPGVDWASGPGVRLLAMPAMAHSATEVRQRVAAGQPIDHLVPAAVAGYIEQHHLYTTA